MFFFEFVKIQIHKNLTKLLKCEPICLINVHFYIVDKEDNLIRCVK